VFGTLNVPPFTFGSQAFLAREGERFGTMYGRRFASSCAELPAAFQAQCGDGKPFQPNDDGLVVWVGSAAGTPSSWRDGITHNLWGQSLPAPQAPWGVPLNWGAPIVVRDTSCVFAPSPTCAGMQLPLGTGVPSSQLSLSTTVSWKRLSFFALLQGTMGRSVWNQGRQRAYLAGTSPELDQAGKTTETAKPMGYYWRAGPADGQLGYGGLYDAGFANSRFVENADFAKLREVALTWDAGSVLGAGQWTIRIVGRNLFTFTRYRGLDPEVPVTTGLAGDPTAVDSYLFPNPRTIGASIGVRF
jgi:hypothetical protein